MSRWTKIAAVVALVSCAAVVSAVLRQQQAQRIADERTEAFQPGLPVVTQPDAYLWVRYAREAESNAYGPEDTMRRPPDSPRRPPDVPLLSRMLAWVSALTGRDLFGAGNLLAIVLPGLFGIPLAIFGWILRRPATGLLGGLVGAVAVGYFVRTDVGSIDTDLLNLFFPAAAAVLLLAAQRSDTRYDRLAAVVALGLTMRLFYLWYAKAGFTLVYALLLGVALWGSRIGWAAGVAHIGAYVLAAGPTVVLAGPRSIVRFVHGYFVAHDPVRATITELGTPSLGDVLAQTLTSPLLAAVGLAGFCAWAVFHRRAALYLSPLVLLGAASPVAGLRFAMYLGPLVGMGFGFAIDLGCQKVARTQARRWATTGAASVVMFGLLLQFTPAGMTPSGPYVPAPTHRAIEAVADHTEPGAVILVWWDYGYAVQAIANRPTMIDGGAPGHERTIKIARGLAAARPAKLAETMRDLSDGRPAYVLVTRDMVDKYGAIARLAGRGAAARADGSTFHRLFWDGDAGSQFQEVMHVPGVARLWRLAPLTVPASVHARGRL